MSFDYYRQRMKSLDIETTGLDPSRDRVWSVGIAYSPTSGNETFIRTKNRRKISQDQSKNFIEGIKRRSLFQESQSKNLEEYRQALVKGDTKTEKQMISSIISSLNPGDILLIQNANFENRFLSESAKKFGYLSDLADKMEFDSVSDKKFYVPPEVTKATQESRAAYDDLWSHYLNEKRKNEPISASVKDVYKKEKMVQQAYFRSFGDSKRGVVVADLMDFSKLLYSTAAAKNMISTQALLNRNVSVDIMSKALLGTTEDHAALSDAKLQLRLFDRVGSILKELESGQVSDNTKASLKRLQRASLVARDQRYISSMINTLEEIQQTGSTRLLGRELSPLTMDVTSKTTGKVTNLTLPNYSKANITSDPLEAIKHVQDRYKNMPKANKASADKIVSGKTDINEMLQGLRGQLSKEQQRVNIAVESATLFDEKMKQAQTAFKDIRINKKTALLAGIGALTIAAFIDTDEPDPIEEDIKKYKLKEQLSKYGGITAQDSFELFKYNVQQYPEVNVYHGTGFYNWENRIGHYGA